jgi:hypothetical protein
VLFVESELKLTADVKVQGAKKLDRDAHLPNLGQSARAIPHNLIHSHGLILANLLSL